MLRVHDAEGRLSLDAAFGGNFLKKESPARSAMPQKKELTMDNHDVIATLNDLLATQRLSVIASGL
jgi:hypothetical protein